MAIKLTSREYCSCQDDDIKEFVCDTEDDVASLPQCCTGSTATVVEGGKLYMVNASGEWAPFGN